MCYHKAQTKSVDTLSEYYSASYDEVLKEVYSSRFHENGFDFKPSPIVTAGNPKELRLFHWGLIPFWVKDEASGKKLRIQTLNCISEEMYDKPSFKDPAKDGKRCLIPCTGFYEWKWLDEKGKTKIPHYIGLKDQELFSIGGLYSRWKNKDTDQVYYSYTVLTTSANPLMAEIHNSKKRMPVIIPREYETDWLNPALTKDDVLAMCGALDDSKMKAHTVSKLITTKGADTNVADVQAVHEYEKVNSK